MWYYIWEWWDRCISHWSNLPHIWAAACFQAVWGDILCLSLLCPSNKKSKVSVPHSSEKCRPFKSSFASMAPCITLQSAGQICPEALVCRRDVLCNPWSRHIQVEAEGRAMFEWAISSDAAPRKALTMQ